MTLRTPVYALAALAAVCPPAVRAGVGNAAAPVVSVQVAESPAVGRASAVACSASDPAGIATLSLVATGPGGASVVLGTATSVSSTAVQWTPALPGSTVLRCDALGLSGLKASAAVTATVTGSAPLGPVISGVTVPGAAVLAGKAVTLAVSAVDPAGGALQYTWSASGGTVGAGARASATWTAPAVAGAYTVKVTVADAAGRTTSRSASINVILSAFQDALPAQLVGPRKIAATAEGDLFVVDATGRLHRLTRRGERMNTSLQGVTSVATGPGVVFAGLGEGAVLQLDARSGRVLARMELGMMQGPAGLAYDAVKGLLWMGFPSGSLEARRADGSKALVISSAGASALRRIVDVAVDPVARRVYVAQDRYATDGTVFAFNADSGAFVAAVGTGTTGQVRVAGGLVVSGGQVYVSDMFSRNVQVFGADGKLLGAIGGGNTGMLTQPAGMAVTATGDLLVADMDGNRIGRFGTGGAIQACPNDSDCDGLPDAWELANGLDPLDPRDAVLDADADGLNAIEELAAGTNPRSKDSDGDGWSDKDELVAGFDPQNGDDHRPALLASAPSATDPGLVRLGSTVSLPQGVAGDCSTAWEQVAGPRVSIGAASSPAPSFIARRAGAYRFRAVASCGGVASLPATVSVAVRNVAPRADAGRVVAIPAGGLVELSGAFSSDANGDRIGFAWDQVLGAPVAGPGTGVAMVAQPTAPGYYVFRLGASDAKAEGGAEVPVVVIGAAGVPTAVASTPVVAAAGDRVVLDASASYHGAAATFSWTQLEGAPVSIDAGGSVVATFVPPAAGRYVFQVGVEENGVRSPPALVEVYASAGGALPVARAEAPTVVAVNAPVTLDGAGSTGATSHAWRQVSGPAAGLTDADRAVATLVPFQAGSYELELVVSDGGAVSFPARVRLEARAGGAPIPVAVASAPATAAVGERVVLDARGSRGAVGYRWTQVDGPWVVVEPGAAGAFTPLVPGVYGFEVEVDDGTVRSAPARVNVVVFQNGTEN